MKIRRYYNRGVKYKYTISDEYLEKLKKERGVSQADSLDNASYEILLETKEEEKEWFFDCLNRVYSNPRYYLDRIGKLPTFKVHIKKIFPEMKK